MANLNTNGTDVERINYNESINNLVVRTGTGNDTVTIDDNRTETTIYGGGGDNTYQIGQIFQSLRDALNANIAAGDSFTTTLTTRGYLSNGVSFDTAIIGGDGNNNFTVYRNVATLDLLGGAGDDMFTIRSFVQENSALSRVNAGSSTNTVTYVANAPIEIDGGGGSNTMRIIATEFDDIFAVTDNGIYGAGRTITYEDIQTVIIDGAEGNDTFYILSTPAIAHVTLYGGLGGDHFIVDGAVPTGTQIDAGQRGRAWKYHIHSLSTLPAATHNLSSIAGSLTIDGGLPRKTRSRSRSCCPERQTCLPRTASSSLSQARGAPRRPTR